MQIDLIFKIAAVGLLVAVINQLLEKSGRSEQAMMVTIAGIIVVVIVLMRELSGLFSLAKSLFGL